MTARHLSRRSTTGRPNVVLGVGPVVLFLIAGVGLCVTVALCFAVAHNGSRTWTHVAANAVGFAIFGWAMLLGLTVRVVLQPRTALRFVNIVFVIDLPLSLIAHLDSRRGLEVVLTDGRTYRSSAFNASVIGNIFGYPRSAKVVNRYHALVDTEAPLEFPEASPQPTRRLRPIFLWLPVWLVAYVAFATVVSAVRA